MNNEVRDIPNHSSPAKPLMSEIVANLGKAVFLPIPEGVPAYTFRNRTTANLYGLCPEGLKLHSRTKDGGIYLWVEQK